VWKEGDREVWVKPLAGGGRALLLFNRGEQPARIRASAEQLGYPASFRARVRDLWKHQDVASWSGSIEAEVEAHGVRMFRIEG
jgi:alpha-galactosidase